MLLLPMIYYTVYERSFKIMNLILEGYNLGIEAMVPKYAEFLAWD